MRFSRRNMLSSAGVVLGSGVLELLTTPLWKWTAVPSFKAATLPGAENSTLVTFVE